MTNKPMLSVERELPELVTENWNGTDARIELRALLDDPEKDYVLINGMHFSHAEILEWREKACADMEKAAQHQGEPVGWRDPSHVWATLSDKTKIEWLASKSGGHIEAANAYTIPLYAEQPAPVVSVNGLMQAVHGVAGFPGVTGDQLRELADRLNGAPKK